MKKKVSILIFVILILGIIGFGIGICKSIPDATDLNEQRIHIPRNIQLEEGETIKIVIPKFIIDASGGKADEMVEQIKGGLRQENVYANEDGTVTEVLTQEQLEQRIQRIENDINRKMNSNDNVNVTISDDFHKIKYIVTKDCTFLEWGIAQLNMRYDAVFAQIYSGVPYNEWYIDDKVIYENGKIVMFEFHLNQEGGWGISESEWDAKMQELSKQ